jgi:hypothetical protein
MKIKFVAIYAIAGAAFLAVSLWAFLSNGKSAKAIRYKYKLGGIMLTAWAMISAVSCEGIPPTVTCYEPEVMCYDPVPSNYVYITVKGYSTETRLHSGHVLEITVESVTHSEFSVRIIAEDENKTVLQSASFAVDPQDPHTAKYEMKIEKFDYQGKARVTVYGIVRDENGNIQAENVVGEQEYTFV